MATLLGEVEWYRGDSYPLELTIKDKATGNVVDISGYSFKFTVDEKENPINTDTQKFSVDGVLDADPATGKASFTPTDSETDLSPKTYFYDVQMIDGSSNKRTIAKGKFKVIQDITK